jgi:hypothetical protein
MNWGVLVGPSAETSLSVVKRYTTSVSTGHSRLAASLKKQFKSNLKPAPKSALRAE